MDQEILFEKHQARELSLVKYNPDVLFVDAHLARIEVLLDWCRTPVRPPSADLLYDAVGALQSLRAAA